MQDPKESPKSSIICQSIIACATPAIRKRNKHEKKEKKMDKGLKASGQAKLVYGQKAPSGDSSRQYVADVCFFSCHRIISHDRIYVVEQLFPRCEPGRVSDGSRPALCQTLSIECRSFIFL